MSHETGTVPEADSHESNPSDIAIGVVIGRSAEFFDFFVYAIASVLVFPRTLFPFLPPVEAMLWSFATSGLRSLIATSRPWSTSTGSA